MKARITIEIPEGNETLLADIKALVDTRLENHSSDARPTMMIARQEAYEVTRKEAGQ